MQIKKVFVELNRRKQVENLAVFFKFKGKKHDYLEFHIRYQETKHFVGYLNEFFLS
jgi:hypothetical protein